jgi:hypothetical protein
MSVLSSTSVYQEVSPFHPDQVELFHLVNELVEHEFPLADLLNGKLQYHFTPDSATHKKLNHLFFESRNRQKLWGSRDLAIGFPLLEVARTAQRDTQFVPLFIWPLHLTKELPGGSKEWVLSTPDHRLPYLNPHLSDLIDRPLPDDWKKWTDQIPWSKAGFQRFLQQISQELNPDNVVAEEPQLAPFPSPSEDVDKDREYRIHTAGILTFFPFLEITSEKVPEPEEKEDEMSPEWDRHHFGLLDLTPTQYHAVELAISHPYSRWQGPSGSGKKKALLYLLSNGLATGKKMVLISDRLGPLDELQQQLDQLGLAPFSFYFHQPSSDLLLLQGLLNGMLERGDSGSSQMSKELSTLLVQDERLKERLDTNYAFFHDAILGQLNWTQLVGHFLRSQREEGKERLFNLLQPGDFAFEVAEYNHLLGLLSRSRKLYEQVNTLKHPLSDLHGDLFTEYRFSESENRVKEQVNRFLMAADRLQYQFVSEMDTFTLRLTDHFQDYALRLAARRDRLFEKIQDFMHYFGEEEVQTSNSGLKIKAIFSSQAREIREKRDILFQEYITLANHFQQQPYFDFEFISVSKQGKELSQISKNLQELGDRLESWKSRIPEIVQEELGRWQSGSVHPGTRLDTETQALETAFERFLHELNEEKLFAFSFEHTMLTIPKKHRYLESVREHIENVRLNFRDFQQVYHWLRHWLQLDERSQKLVHALIKARPEKWEVAFSSWYLHHCLQNSYQDSFQRSEEDLSAYAEIQKKLRQALPRYIEQINLHQQAEALKKWKRTDRANWQALQSLRPGQSLGRQTTGELLASAWPYLSEVYPITLMPLPVAKYFFAQVDCPYDEVIFLESEEISETVLQTWKQRVPRQLLIRDVSGSTLMEEEANPTAVAKFTTDFSPLHQIHTPVSTPSLAHKPSVNYVGGTYDEHSRTNITEAEALLQLINQVKPTPQRTYPSVGLVTLTREQRNLVADFLIQIKRKHKPGSEKILQLERNGLSVLSLEEVAGTNLDALYLSCTWGGHDLPHDLQEMEQESMKHAFLHLIRSGTSLKRVIHSFNRTQLQSLGEAKVGTGSFLLGAYLQYLSGTTHWDELPATWQQSLLGIIPERPASSVFIEELLFYLQQYFSLEEVKINQKFGEVTIPLSFQVAGHPERLVLIPDGFLINQLPHTSFEWEWEILQAILKEYDHYQIVWTANWWRNPEAEARKLAGQLLKILQPEPSVSPEIVVALEEEE